MPLKFIFGNNFFHEQLRFGPNKGHEIFVEEIFIR